MQLATTHHKQALNSAIPNFYLYPTDTLHIPTVHSGVQTIQAALLDFMKRSAHIFRIL